VVRQRGGLREEPRRSRRVAGHAVALAVRVAEIDEGRGVVAGGRVEERGGGRVLADAVAAGVVGLADARERRRLRARDGFARGNFEE
jgi:hypothetical protein